MKKLFVILLLLMSSEMFAQKTQIALLKYRGGGDWYSNPTSLPNLVKFCNQSLKTDLNPDVATVDAGSPDIFNYPFVHMTGHGNVVFNDNEVNNIRTYLIGGGFLHIDDSLIGRTAKLQANIVQRLYVRTVHQNVHKRDKFLRKRRIFMRFL